ncbi:palmitoyltransferase pfa5 [Ascosphaera aggregata]|nr:palmitoyltransferase pfa5 [Ascosphaera aggregata]
MIFSSVHNVLMNLTTIESINRKQRNYTLAIIVPKTSKFNTQPRGPNDPKIITTVTFPSATDPRFGADSVLVPHGETRTFVVVKTDKGESLFDLGSIAANWKELMGYHFYEWFLPWTSSPCQNHSLTEGAYRTGPAVARLKKKYGLEPGYAPAPVVLGTSAPTLAPTAATDAIPDDDPSNLPDESEPGLSSLLIDDGYAGGMLDASVAAKPAIPRSARAQGTAGHGRLRSRSHSHLHTRNEGQTHSLAASNRHPHQTRYYGGSESILRSGADPVSKSSVAHVDPSSSTRHPRKPSKSRTRTSHERSSSRSRSRSRSHDWDQPERPQYLSQSSPTLPAAEMVN